MAISMAGAAGGRPVRRRDYPGWRMVWALAVTETISYGVLYYSFAAFLLPMQHSLESSPATLSGAFSLSVLLTGVGAIPAGAWLDCCGARAPMTAGSLFAAGCVQLWAQAGSVLGLYLAFAGIGLAGAAVLYEPAFATVNAYFDVQRRHALLTLSMVAGLASTIFVPGAALLISSLGWRHALLILAVVQAATIIPHALLLRRRPADHGWLRDGLRRFPGPLGRLTRACARDAAGCCGEGGTRGGGPVAASRAAHRRCRAGQVPRSLPWPYICWPTCAWTATT